MPRSKEQFDEMKSSRRNEILKSALPLFSLRGYDAVKVDDITKECGCSHGLFYHYFSSKEDLFRAMMEESKAVGRRCYPRTWLDNSNPVESVNIFVNNIINLLLNDEENCYYMYLYLTSPYQKTLPKPKNSDKKQKYFPELLLEIIQTGQKGKTFNEGNPLEITHLFLSLLRGLFYERLNKGKDKFCCPSKKLLLKILLKDETISSLEKEVI